MVDMKMTQSEAQEWDSPMEMSSPQYPYGLCIDLDKPSLEKLGKSTSDFEMGQEMEITCMVRVKSLSSSSYEDGDKHESVGLQITDMELDSSESDSDKARMKRMYGDDDDGEY